MVIEQGRSIDGTIAKRIVSENCSLFCDKSVARENLTSRAGNSGTGRKKVGLVAKNGSGRWSTNTTFMRPDPFFHITMRHHLIDPCLLQKKELIFFKLCIIEKYWNGFIIWIS